MQRSWINTILADAEDFLAAQGAALPPFALWSAEHFKTQVNDLRCAEIVRRSLGWTVTDFGLGKFEEHGAVSFATRRGSRGQNAEDSWQFAEKYLVLRGGQSMPMQRRRRTAKDIANRSASTLLAQFYRADAAGELDKTGSLTVYADGQQRELAPGEIIALAAGQSVAVDAGTYYELSASGTDVLACEIELGPAGDGEAMFYMPVAVQQEIYEDEPYRRLLVQDYRSHFPGLAQAAG